MSVLVRAALNLEHVVYPAIVAQVVDNYETLIWNSVLVPTRNAYLESLMQLIQSINGRNV